MPEVLCGFFDAPGLLGRDALVQWGPTLIVDIGFDPNYNPSAPQGSLPNLQRKGLHALVDTGASECCIDSGLAMQLNLPTIDRRTVAGVSGQHEVNIHLGSIHVEPLFFTIYGAFAGVNLIAGGQPHYALIGRTFLQHFTMSYEGSTGTVKICHPAKA
jgi:predicted aspartyl protease